MKLVDDMIQSDNNATRAHRWRLALFRRRWRLIGIAVSLLVMICTLVIVRHWPRPSLEEQIASSTAVLDRKERLLRLTLAADDQYRLWTPLEEISPELIEALLLHEDRHFYRHPGFNLFSFVRAAFSTYTGGPRIGGSTLTMQLARLMYGLNTRSVGGKLTQIACAIELELKYSKRDILEAHLNLMPYSGNVQGVGTASLIYFNKRAKHLDLAESLALVLIPQAPVRRTPADIEPDELREARHRLFDRWVEEHPGAQTLRESFAIPLQFASTRDLPFDAPHFVNEVLSKEGRGLGAWGAGQRKKDDGDDGYTRTSSPRHLATSSLDLSQQRLLERVLQTYIRERSGVGIRNASALLVDSRDMSIRAMVGSARFHSLEIHGQVNGTLAKRSPGSALKPFIYALAIDQGLIHPLTILRDAPTAFGPFSPENFDGRFVGPISATDSLNRSRNVPAVALSSQLAQPNLYQFLKAAGVAKMASERHYGLALALGGGEVTMAELAMLYAMLANRGELRPLRYDDEHEMGASQQRPSVRMLSEEAAFMTLEMLKSTPRADDPFTRKQHRVVPAWKTGTSWGFRDAWTAGVFGPYVLVVWVGNFDGVGNPAFVGIQAAAPLFFRIVDAIAATEPNLAEPAFRQPPRLARVEVCAASGDLPNAECPQTTITWYIPGVSPIKVSDVHRRVWIDTRTGRQACPPFDPTHTRSEVFEYWPSELMQLFEQAGMPRRRPPEAPECSSAKAFGSPPRITSPLTTVTYTLRAHRIGSDTIPLAANADSEARRVHWFVDASYVGTSPPGVALGWTPQRPGSYLVRAVDDRGGADTRALEVRIVD